MHKKQTQLILMQILFGHFSVGKLAQPWGSGLWLKPDDQRKPVKLLGYHKKEKI